MIMKLSFAIITKLNSEKNKLFLSLCSL